MSATLKLTREERHTLLQLTMNHSRRGPRTRAMGLLWLARCQTLSQVAAELGVSTASISNWSRAWRERGICGLLGGPAGGRPRALSEAMVATAVEAACAESMTLPKIAKQIEAVHATTLPCTFKTLAAALKAAGLSYKRSRYSLKKTATKNPSA